jgi:hypothetical protein
MNDILLAVGPSALRCTSEAEAVWQPVAVIKNTSAVTNKCVPIRQEIQLLLLLSYSRFNVGTA